MNILPGIFRPGVVGVNYGRQDGIFGCRRLPLLLLLLTTAGCTALRQEPAVRSPAAVHYPVLTATASIYGAEFFGRTTASGDTFDPHKFTAAHRTLPFGTLVKVVNPRTRQQTVVRINDRGPFVKGRELDLSPAAAEALGIETVGVEDIEIQILEVPRKQ